MKPYARHLFCNASENCCHPVVRIHFTACMTLFFPISPLLIHHRPSSDCQYIPLNWIWKFCQLLHGYRRGGGNTIWLTLSIECIVCVSHGLTETPYSDKERAKKGIQYLWSGNIGKLHCYCSWKLYSWNNQHTYKCRQNFKMTENVMCANWWQKNEEKTQHRNEAERMIDENCWQFSQLEVLTHIIQSEKTAPKRHLPFSMSFMPPPLYQSYPNKWNWEKKTLL